MNVLPRAQRIEVVRYLLAGATARGVGRALKGKVSRDTVDILSKQLRAGKIPDIEAAARAMVKPDLAATKTEKRGTASGALIRAETTNVPRHPNAVDVTDADLLLFGFRALAAAKGIPLPADRRRLLDSLRSEFAVSGEADPSWRSA